MIKIDRISTELNAEIFAWYVAGHLRRTKYKNSKQSLWSKISKWVSETSENDIELWDLLVARPEDFDQYAMILYRRTYPDFVNQLKDEYKKLSRDGIGFENTKFRIIGAELSQLVGLNVCPYCNRNFISGIDKSKRRTCQFDHFLPQPQFPFFALSYYNLIPCCSTCNHLKGNTEVSISPYMDLDINSLLTFSYKGSVANMSSIEVGVDPEPEFESNINIFYLKELYQHHLDYIHEILLREYTNPPSKIDEHVKSGIFRNSAHAKRVLFANYTDISDLGKRPLAKLTRDILKSLGRV